MKDSVIVLDDCVPEKIQDAIENLCVSTKFPWNYNQSSNYGSYTNKNNGLEDFNRMTEISSGVDVSQFTHSVYHYQHQKNSEYLVLFASLLSCLPVSVDTLLRIKLNLNYAHKNLDNAYTIPHVDFVSIENLTTFIYYVNDSDGDTVIFNEKRTGPELCPKEQLTIKHIISPKKGRFIMFDGSYLHAGGFPSGENPRIVVNLNIIPHKFFGITNNA